MTLAFESATALAQKIREKEISARELADYYIDRIERLDGAVNAVPVRDFERAREAADMADQAQAAGRSLGPLHGLPMTIKEAYNIAGLPTTWGHPVFRDNVDRADAEVVKRLKAAGALFLGKTNVPINLADFQSYNEVYGTTNNPWDTTRTPGGSSGGSAAALAAGFCGLESGSDIGGSIRNPAHFCGVYGHKPTWGIVPPQGHALPGMVAPPDIAVVGPMARSAKDLALAMEIMAGAEPLNAPGWKLDLARPKKETLSEFRVAIWADDPAAPVSAEMADRVQSLGDQLGKHGATVSDTARPGFNLEASWQTYMYMLCGVMAAGLPDEAFKGLQKAAEESAPDDTGFTATWARASVQHHTDWLRWNNLRETLRMAWRQFFNDWDILICPQMATTAFPHDHSDIANRQIMVDQEAQLYFQQLFWAGLVTVSYLPSTVFPTGPGADGLPIGLQAVGAEFNDYGCIQFAHLVEREFGGFVAPPGFSD
ncbi:MAG: amidase [Alphaproteobacteria bacterium]|jgi:amidase|nr:amidase [Alphaproteobacteria bacterium]